MTIEEQKLALLEWAGWTYIKGVSEYDGMEMPYTIWKHGDKKYNSKDIPNLFSLDVIAEFVMKLPEHGEPSRDTFIRELQLVTAKNKNWMDACVNATAPQRLEALVRTLGLWKE